MENAAHFGLSHVASNVTLWHPVYVLRVLRIGFLVLVCHLLCEVATILAFVVCFSSLKLLHHAEGNPSHEETSSSDRKAIYTPARASVILAPEALHLPKHGSIW